MPDTVQLIKERLSIVDVVQPYVKLTRAGRYWKGLSPFTKEKTPSFFVTPDKGFYHCFSTGKGGDMFTFIEEMEGVDFKGALKILAEKAGVEIVSESKESRDERQELYDTLDAAASFYEERLKERADVQEYLSSRTLTEATLKHFRVGYAPKDWRLLKDHLLAKGFSEPALLAAGLIKRPDREDGSTDEKRTYDRFRGRIMFPIFDVSNRVIAFSGRIFEDSKEHPQAKYLNSPEGALFDKSRALYGIQDAKGAIRTLGFSMLVEGQVDLLLSHQAGYRSAVATSGTAFTASHVEVLKRYSQNMLLSYDGDQAGVNATYRAALILLDAGMNVKVVALPSGADPADLIGKNAEEFKACVRNAEPVIDFFVGYLQRTIKDERKRILEVGSVVVPLIARIKNALDQAHFVRRVAESIRVPEEAIRTELAKLATQGTENEVQNKNPFFAPEMREMLLFGILTTLEESKNDAAAYASQAFTSEYGTERLATLRVGTVGEIEAAKIVASENFFELHKNDQKEALEALFAERPHEHGRAKIAYETLSKALKKAESEKNDTEVGRIMAELRELSKKLE